MASKNDIGTTLQAPLKNAMEAFKTQNGIAPKNIIFFRDGLGPLGRNSTIEQETLSVRAAIREFIGIHKCEGKQPTDDDLKAVNLVILFNNILRQ